MKASFAAERSGAEGRLMAWSLTVSGMVAVVLVATAGRAEEPLALVSVKQ